LAIGWCAAVLLATLCLRNGRPVVILPVTLLSGTLLSVPSAVLAAVCLWLELPPAAAIAAVVFPRVFPHVHQQLCAGLDKPHVVMAQARGLSWARVFFWHILPATLLPIVALAGVSVTLALGASIPVEALADSPGLGSLAWRAALGRDIPVLVTITLLLTTVTVLANLVSETISIRLRAHAL
jgi:peptide/nickel transport system permease protein